MEHSKFFVFVVSAIMAGVAGALYVPQVGIINPSEFAPANSIEIVIWVALGGRGTLVGAAVGALIVAAGKSWLTAAFPEIWLFVLGAAFILVTIFLPRGVLGLIERVGRGRAGGREAVFGLFPVLGEMLNRRGGDLSGGQQQQLAIGRAMVTRPKLLLMDEPTEGIQPSIIRDIGRAIAFLRDQGHMAIVLVEQFFDFAVELADRYAVMERGRIVLAGATADIDEAAVRRRMTV